MGVDRSVEDTEKLEKVFPQHLDLHAPSTERLSKKNNPGSLMLTKRELICTKLF